MKLTDALEKLNQLDANGRYIFTLHDLKKIFPEENQRSLVSSLQRLVKQGILVRAVKGVFVFTYSKHKARHTLELIAKTMRRGEYSYISLESALSEYGVISQIPIDRITVMTTGRTGQYDTPFGVIEFTHTKRPVQEIVGSIKYVDRPLRMAHQFAAVRDLKRVGRNLHLIHQGVLNEN